MYTECRMQVRGMMMNAMMGCLRSFLLSSPAPLRGKDDDDIALVIDSGRIIESDQILSLVCPSSIYIEPRLGTQ